MRLKDYIIAGVTGSVAIAATIFGGPKLLKAFASEDDDPVIDPVEAGVLEVAGGFSSSGGGISAVDTTDVIDDGITRVTIPLDEPEPFAETIGKSVVEVSFEAPELFVSTEDGQIVPTFRTETVTRNTDGTQTSQTVFVDQFGNTFNSEQELLDAAVKISDEINAELQRGDALSTIEALVVGAPINTTNFITERPTSFPEAKIDSRFQERAQAIGKTLTSSNPGASSASRIANFSRLAALGTDLSKIDIFGVQNPDFLREIKTGQGPLTEAQKRLLDQVRLRTDPRNMTSSDFEEIRRNQARREAEKTALQKEVEALRRSGLTPETAKDILNRFGFAVSGPVTLELFATLNDRFGEVQQPQQTRSAAELDDARKALQTSVTQISGTDTRSQQIDNLKNFLAQTGRSNLDNLAPAELFRLNRAGFSNVNPAAGPNQPAIQALKLLILEVK